MKNKRWRRRLFAPMKRKMQAAVTAGICVCIILYMAADDISSGYSSALVTEERGTYLDSGEEKKPLKRAEYGIRFQWKEGRIVFYRAKEEPYIFKEAETAAIH